jgi:hypothetical protein
MTPLPSADMKPAEAIPLWVIRVVGGYRHLHADVRYASESDGVATLPRNDAMGQEET